MIDLIDTEYENAKGEFNFPFASRQELEEIESNSNSFVALPILTEHDNPDHR
jgi:hypothetical protein